MRSSQQVSGSSLDCGKQDWHVFPGQRNLLRQLLLRCLEQVNDFGQSAKPGPLILFLKIDSGLLQCIC